MSEQRDRRSGPDELRRRRTRREGEARTSNRLTQGEPSPAARYQRADADMYLAGGPPGKDFSGRGIATLILLLLTGLVVVGLFLGWPQVIAGWRPGS